jgi:Holliday junction DNA helicase RuvB
MYSADELSMIVKRSSKILGININEYGANEIASRSRGTPRIANRLLRRIRDFAQVEGVDVITSEIADYGLLKLEIDKIGLDNIDRAILKTIIIKFNGGPVGLENTCCIYK